MQNMPYIATIILLIIACGMLAVRYVKYSKSMKNDKCVITGFITMYENTILSICKNCISIMSIDPKNYSDDELIKTLTDNVVMSLKDTSMNLGINEKWLDLISSDALAEAISDFIKTHKVDIFKLIFSTTDTKSEKIESTNKTVEIETPVAVDSKDVSNKDDMNEETEEIPVDNVHNETVSSWVAIATDNEEVGNNTEVTPTETNYTTENK